MPQETNNCEIFEKINIGVIILDNNTRCVIYSNQHFKTLAGEYVPIIVDNIFLYLDSKKPLSVRTDMKIDSDTFFGYTIYKYSDSKYLVLFSDLSYKKIYFDSQEENHFYDWLSNLIAEMVHEIGNPLTSVNTTLQVLLDSIDTWDVPKSKEYVQRAVNEIERLSKYIQRIRDFSAVSIFLDKRAVYLRSVIDRVIDQNKAMMDVKQISISCNVEAKLRVMVDEDVFYQVLLNLLQNSVDHLSRGGRIWLEVEESNEFFVKLIYRNDGPTIPKEIMDKIFMPFYTTKREGSGIGLAVSLKFMTRMGGKIEARIPDDGKGVKFVLYIPAYRVYES